MYFENDQQLLDFLKYNKKLYSPTITLPSELSWYMGMIIGFHGRNIKEVAKELGLKYIKVVVEQ